MKKPELLAPAGNMDSLKAAIEAGCDAVYVGGYLFGARSYATNFDNDELQDAVSLCHLYGVKLYVTVNTLIYEDEVELFVSYVDFLVSIHVDALIIQDLGMMDLIHQLYPDLELHASTQMHIHNLNGVLMAEKLGLKRVVLARETDIDLLREIVKDSSIELEVFVQGALCISYSGQCFMSSLIGGRSGNRGTCAGSCRKCYDLIVDSLKVNDEDYLLSTKDLMTLEYLGQLIDLGIASLKIEGRMKRPEYVYYVVSLYRKAIDQYCESGNIMIDSTEIDQLKRLFHRGFTKGFLFHEKNNQIIHSYRPNHMGVDVGHVVRSNGRKVTIQLSDTITVGDGLRFLGDHDEGLLVTKMFYNGNDVSSSHFGCLVTIPFDKLIEPGSRVIKTTDIVLMKQIQDQMTERKRKVMIHGHLVLRKGEKIQFSVTDGINEVFVISDYVALEACNAPLTEERVRTQMEKLGDFVYVFSDLLIDMDSNVFVVMKELNILRRRALGLLNEKRLERSVLKKCVYHKEVPNTISMEGSSCLIHTYEHYVQIKDLLFSRIYVSSLSLYYQISLDERVYYRCSRVLEHPCIVNGKVMIGELGSILDYNDFIADFSFHVTNSYTLAFLTCLGARLVTLSYEITDDRIALLCDAYQNRYGVNPNLEIIVYGREEVMVSKYQILASYGNSDFGYLKDSYGNLYPIVERDKFTYIYNYHPRLLNGDYSKMGVNSMCYHILNQEDVLKVRSMIK